LTNLNTVVDIYFPAESAEKVQEGVDIGSPYSYLQVSAAVEGNDLTFHWRLSTELLEYAR